MANRSWIVLVIAVVWTGMSYSQELNLPGCEADAFAPVATLLLLNAACEAAAPETKDVRAAELQKAREKYPGCFRAFEESPEHVTLFSRLTAETMGTASTQLQEIRENCKVRFNGS
jgi:hypothetical protein